MAITPAEIAETRGMVEEQNLDIRTITMGVSLMGCGDENLDRMCTKIYDHVTHTAEHLVRREPRARVRYPHRQQARLRHPGGADRRVLQG